MSTMLLLFRSILTVYVKVLFVHGTADNVRLRMQFLPLSLTLFRTGKLREGHRATLQFY